MLNIIQCYALRNDHDEEAKEEFYYKLQSILDKLKKKKNMTILIGDLNAKMQIHRTSRTWRYERKWRNVRRPLCIQSGHRRECPPT